jgi:hypothetical protein
MWWKFKMTRFKSIQYLPSYPFHDSYLHYEFYCRSIFWKSSKAKKSAKKKPRNFKVLRSKPYAFYKRRGKKKMRRGKRRGMSMRRR